MSNIFDHTNKNLPLDRYPYMDNTLKVKNTPEEDYLTKTEFNEFLLDYSNNIESINNNIIRLTTDLRNDTKTYRYLVPGENYDVIFDSINDEIVNAPDTTIYLNGHVIRYLFNFQVKNELTSDTSYNFGIVKNFIRESYTTIHSRSCIGAISAGTFYLIPLFSNITGRFNIVGLSILSDNKINTIKSTLEDYNIDNPTRKKSIDFTALEKLFDGDNIR